MGTKLNTYYLKMYVETSSLDECERCISSISNVMSDTLKFNEVSTQQYWKIPEYMEVELAGQVKELSKEEFEDLCSKLATGWDFTYTPNEYGGIWNPDDKNQFVVDNIKWASSGVY